MGIIPPPHIFRVDLVLEDPENPTKEIIHNFRYLADMDTEKEPKSTTSDGAKAKQSKD